jgi:hypothetical protein
MDWAGVPDLNPGLYIAIRYGLPKENIWSKKEIGEYDDVT